MARGIACCLLQLTAMLTAGCASEPVQSALHPAGPAAAKIAWLGWIMTAAFTAVFVLVIALLLRAVLCKRQAESAAPPLGRTGFIVAGGVVLPAIVVLPLYVLSLETSISLRQPKEAATIRVVGHMWWWEVHYPEQGIVTANEIHIPVGQPVRLELTSADVIHSFWVPRLNGKRDMIPGQTNEFWLQADEPGHYRGQCGEYCGMQHANMAFVVIALPPDEFRAWVLERQTPHPEPATPERRQGLQIFLTAGCAECHSISGTSAVGKIGPDLTHIGGRQTLGAGTIPNTPGHLAGWIANPQAIKPANKMPRTYVGSDDLNALVSYLEGLK